MLERKTLRGQKVRTTKIVNMRGCLRFGNIEYNEKKLKYDINI